MELTIGGLRRVAPVVVVNNGEEEGGGREGGREGMGWVERRRDVGTEGGGK